jgi:hypothetical protein
VTDSEVSRYEGEVLNELATMAVNHIEVGRAGPRSGTVALAAILWSLPQQLRLHGEDVVEHAIDPPALQAVLGDHAGMLELASKRCSQRPVDAGLPAHLGFLKQQ